MIAMLCPWGAGGGARKEVSRMKHRFLGATAALLIAAISPAWPARYSQYVRLPANTVLKARLNQTVSSASNRAGDSFTATLRDPSLPEGTVARGVIIGANKSGADKPGRLGLGVRTQLLPHGRQIPLPGSPLALD